MSRASVLARGRTAAQAGMVDACTIVRVTGTTTDPDTGEVSETTSQVYSGPCRLQERGGYPRDIAVAPDQPQLAVARELQLPIATSGSVRAGDRATITASANDSASVGRRFWLRGQPSKTDATARRFHTEEIAG